MPYRLPAKQQLPGRCIRTATPCCAAQEASGGPGRPQTWVGGFGDRSGAVCGSSGPRGRLWYKLIRASLKGSSAMHGRFDRATTCMAGGTLIVRCIAQVSRLTNRSYSPLPYPMSTSFVRAGVPLTVNSSSEKFTVDQQSLLPATARSSVSVPQTDVRGCVLLDRQHLLLTRWQLSSLVHASKRPRNKTRTSDDERLRFPLR